MASPLWTISRSANSTGLADTNPLRTVPTGGGSNKSLDLPMRYTTTPLGGQIFSPEIKKGDYECRICEDQDSPRWWCNEHDAGLCWLLPVL